MERSDTRSTNKRKILKGGFPSFIISFFERTKPRFKNGLIPRRGLPVGEVFASLAINHITDGETLHKFSKWYRDTALEELTGITPEKLNSTNLGAVMKTGSKIGPEGIVDVCIELFNRIKHLETETSTLIYDLALALYKHHLGVTGWAGVEDSLDERVEYEKLLLILGAKVAIKFLFSLKSKRRLLESWDLRMRSFKSVEAVPQSPNNQ
jgi:hypothetical protein